MSNGDGIYLREANSTLSQSLINDGQYAFHMSPRGEFWNNSSVLTVDFVLRRDDGSQHFQTIGDHGGRGFVTS
jgi:hypothetical protein